jgi:hypothetical protein
LTTVDNKWIWCYNTCIETDKQELEMAYMNQDKKAAIAPNVKAILKKYNVKGSLAVRNHSTLVLTVKSGSIDFINNFNKVASARYPDRFNPAKDSLDVNPYWYKEHFDGKALAFLSELFPVMNKGNHDNSDIQSDYFDVGWYVDVNIGKWNKPYVLEK